MTQTETERADRDVDQRKGGAMTQTETELRDLSRRFIFQGGSPFALDLANQLARADAAVVAELVGALTEIAFHSVCCDARHIADKALDKVQGQRAERAPSVPERPEPGLSD